MTVLRVVDIETTGMTPPEAEVIELGMHDVLAQPDGSEARMSGEPYRAWLYTSSRPCPPEVLAVHHILPEMNMASPMFVGEQAARNMEDVTGMIAAYYVAHNAEFEMSFLAGGFGETPWICTYKAALRIWPEAPSHGNQALMYWLGGHHHLDEDSRHPPHRAGPDAYVTAFLLRRILSAGYSPQELVQWTLEPRLLPTCPIGKFRGRKWADVDYGFLSWMLRQPDMEADLRWNAQRELERRRTAHHAGD